ncbi:SDR family oxidoreductase [soil metagenome]
MRPLDVVLDKTMIGYTRLGPAARKRSWPADPAPHALKGRRVLVTGGGGGLGLATAHGLAALDAEVHLVGRNLTTLEKAAADLRATHRGVTVEIASCDLSDLDSVRAYAAQVAAGGTLRALIHNAGVMPPERTLSTQGHELAFATHVLGPFLLTELLRPSLASDGDARVVWVSSGGMYGQPFTTEIAVDLEYEKGDYNGVTAYARTKRMQVILSKMLAPKLAADGVAVNAMHPGWAATPGVTESLPRFAKLMGPLLRSGEQGADTTVWLAAAPGGARKSGLFWHDRRPRPETYLKSQLETPELRERLWAACVEATGVSPA